VDEAVPQRVPAFAEATGRCFVSETERPGEIVLSTVGETVTVTVAGTIDVRLVVALRKVLQEIGGLTPTTLRLHLLISVDGAELVARLVRETQARFRVGRLRFLVATPDPAVLRLLAGARIVAELQPRPATG
jgi:hypothetical protein